MRLIYCSPLDRFRSLQGPAIAEIEHPRLRDGFSLDGSVGDQLAAVARPCDNAPEMRKLIIMVLLMLLVAAPVAMAADGCSGMICDASCSAPCVSVSPSMGDAVL